MYLKDILKGVSFNARDDISALKIKNVTCDSRLVKKGDLFVAVRGCSVNGSRFITDAAAKGACAVIAEEDFDAPKGAKKVLVYDTRRSLPVIASNFYDHPSKRLKTVGVTGTNGKTTITYILEKIIKECGGGVGVIGTVNYRIKEKVLPSKNTTPGPLELQSMLHRMVGEEVNYAVMEVSSHALDQGRVDCVSFDVGIFTNITSDHLDYHKTAANYFEAKSKLFTKLKEGAAAVLNNDDRKVASLKSAIGKKVITYGVKKDADVKAGAVRTSLDSSRFVVSTPVGSFPVSTKLIGIHNVSNILAAITAAFALRIDLKDIKRGVESADFVPGRLESVDAGQPFKVFVDYAHTEDALYNILGLLKKTVERRILTVFGCGGNRDVQKRPLMGRVACALSDHVVVTSDNPRFEEPEAIVKNIECGVKGDYSNYDIVIDRRKAIEKALAIAAPGDIVLIAGKGHENYQIVKGKVVPFDDREVARGFLKALMAKGRKRPR